jgi:hypothetical protein
MLLLLLLKCALLRASADFQKIVGAAVLLLVLELLLLPFVLHAENQSTGKTTLAGGPSLCVYWELAHL